MAVKVIKAKSFAASVQEDLREARKEINAAIRAGQRRIIEEHTKTTGLKRGAKTLKGQGYRDVVEAIPARGRGNFEGSIKLIDASFPIGRAGNISSQQTRRGVKVRNYYRKGKLFRSAFKHPNHHKRAVAWNVWRREGKAREPIRPVGNIKLASVKPAHRAVLKSQSDTAARFFRA